jgi:Right handed beta helix region
VSQISGFDTTSVKSSSRSCESPKAPRFFGVAALWFLLVCAGLSQTLSVKGKVPSATVALVNLPEACTHYVAPTGSDSNPGAIETPWRHLQKAFDALVAGQVACLRSGTYEPNGTFNSPSYRHTFSGTGEPNNPIVIRSYPGETAIILGEVVVRGSHVKFIGNAPSGGLIFQGPLGPDASGVKGKGASQVWLDRCHNVVLDHVEIRNNDSHAGLYVSEVSDVQVLGCYVHDNGRFDVGTDAIGQHPVNVDQGIYWAASSGTNRIANCLLEHNRSYNLQLFASSGRITGLTVVHNTIVKAMNSGILIGKGADGNVIAHNIIAMNSQQTNDGQMRLAQDARNNIIDTNIGWPAASALEGLDTSPIRSGNVVRNLILRDPRFVNFPGGDYHLQPGSPAIGASFSIDVERADINGMRRPSQPSLGAFEYRPPQ